MKIGWYMPDGPRTILNGEMSIRCVTNMRPFVTYVITDQARGWNILRVNFEHGETEEEIHEFMKNMLDVAQIKYNDWKEKHGNPATV